MNNGDGMFIYNINGVFEYLVVGEIVIDSFIYIVDDGNGGILIEIVIIIIIG